MREINFSIPNVNKASVGITTALYDRRALDCTSTLPLINSLNHLAYLTTSSARIRDILTIDGGVERLVCLLKAGRSKDPMDMWKWNLAFQCVVNVGVRGSENVRTRVVEADLIPVIATILDNYIKVFDRYREKAEEALQAKEQRSNGSRSLENQISNKDTPFGNRTVGSQLDFRGTRRHLPPSLELPSASTNFLTTGSDSMEITPNSQQTTTSSPSERSGFLASRHYYRIQDTRQHTLPPSRHNIQPLIAAVPSMDAADGFSIRPVRDIDRLPSMVVRLHNHISQPESPTTPLPSNLVHSTNLRPASTTTQVERSSRRPTIRHQTSLGATEDPNNDSILSDESGIAEISGDSTTAIQSPVNVDIQEIDMEEDDSILSAVESRLGLNQNTVSDTQDVGAFNHRFTFNGSTAENNALPTGQNLGFMPGGQTEINIPHPIHFSNLPRFPMDRANQFHALTAMPRDEDILMSLQLLAYVSKYCNLRPYFQKSHLVPKLKIGAELKLLDMEEAAQFSGYSTSNTTTSNMNCSSSEENEEEEYLLPDDFNIFPLVEKFTIRHHPQDMQYWAGVVMRNLCRKDDSRGGIRQCAHYQCGKWEQFTRQFAKCRRCRRTKYCSKECQKSAWIFHRHWCVAATP
ncbi:MYND-type zinc finger protein samB [Erysiphe neolycopersici]|uniref:MYND-type zinc finger protein samB n=1 Tax=Erysiphe neolycopersici TaxID=212602 RepID=A0A420I4F9_9PEZI|nr:MYND-type zinc finger protein samB [Erysiphe neolycopersici]